LEEKSSPDGWIVPSTPAAPGDRNLNAYSMLTLTLRILNHSDDIDRSVFSTSHKYASAGFPEPECSLVTPPATQSRVIG
jgi:hypothetical protein